MFAQDDDAGQLVRVVEVFLAPGGGLGHVDGGENTLLGDGAIEMDLHVAGAFEFLKDEIVHAALRFDEGGRDDGQAAAFFGVARGAEEALGLDERLGIDASGHDAAFAGLQIVVAAGQTGDAVEEDDDILADFDESFGAFDDKFGQGGVALR